jgi:hypothetical protein
MPSDKRLVGLRLDDETYEALETAAKKEQRTVANMAELLVRRGLEKEDKHPKPASKAQRQR